MWDQVLMAFVVLIALLTIFAIVTSEVTPEERDEMLSDEEMWP